MPRISRLVVTCEHGGNRVPAGYRSLFAEHRDLLESHRGYDPGAAELARRFARRFHAPLVVSTVTRLLVELNRSPDNRELFSELSRRLPEPQRRAIFRRYYLPHRRLAESTIRAAGQRPGVVLHLAVHSFTPVLYGKVRRCDVGLLCDPRRKLEDEFVEGWRTEVLRADPALRVRKNYPYRGWSDGLTTAFRREFPAGRYLGIELEVNQQWVFGPRQRWLRLQHCLMNALETRMGTPAD